MCDNCDVKMKDENILLKKFNNRDDVAFGEIYHLFYNELYYFTAGLYRDSAISPKDVLQDVFIKILESKSPEFDSIRSLKGYLYTCIKNKFRNYIDHKKSIEKYNTNVQTDDRNFVSQIVEVETLSIITQAINVLPAECAKVFKLHVEGWDIADIATKLGKSESTVYAQKNRAISILKNKLSKNSLSLLFSFINI